MRSAIEGSFKRELDGPAVGIERGSGDVQGFLVGRGRVIRALEDVVIAAEQVAMRVVAPGRGRQGE